MEPKMYFIKDLPMANFSYSKVDTYLQCPFKYRLQYVDGHYTYLDSIATEFGSAIHATEEGIAKAIQARQPINYVQLKNNLIKKLYELQYKYPNDFVAQDKSDRTYEQKAYKYLKTGIYRLEKFLSENPNLSVVGVEQGFNVSFCGQNFKGFIDRVLKDNSTDTYIIQDIKTYAQAVEKDKLTTPLQFVVYVLAAKQLYGKSDDDFSCQYDLPLCNLTQDAGTKGFMSRGVKKLTESLDCISNKQFDPNPTPLCHWCQFCSTNPNAPDESKLLCPYHSLWTRETKNFGKANEWKGEAKHKEIMEKYLATAIK